jgi:beta-lactamase regulating signal transducer with metallopeptidase domain
MILRILGSFGVLLIILLNKILTKLSVQLLEKFRSQILKLQNNLALQTNKKKQIKLQGSSNLLNPHTFQSE